MTTNTKNLALYKGGEVEHVDLSVLHGGEAGGESATLEIRDVFRWEGEAAIYQCIDDCFGREHEVTEAQIRAAL